MLKMNYIAVAVIVSVIGLVACGIAPGAESTPTVKSESVETEAPAAEGEKEVLATEVVEAGSEPVDYGKVVILSTQGVPDAEARGMRERVLADFPGQPEFVGIEDPRLLNRVLDEAGAKEGTVDVIITVHGNYPTLVESGALMDLSDLQAGLDERGIPAGFIELGRLGTNVQYYIPLMQATYIFAANEEAITYLPEGVDPEALTWDTLRDWTMNISEEAGEKKFGLPAGEEGLLHRFIQGYLYPSFTGGMVTRFRSDEAVMMWEFTRELWQYTHPQTGSYSFMDQPLLADEVWLAFDHTARLRAVFEQRPDEFVALPAPTGPEGLGFMPVVVGMAIPQNTPNPEGAEAMVEYLLQDDVQVNILREIGFFPVASVSLPDSISKGVQIQGYAVARQVSSPQTVPALLPVGLNNRDSEINQIYRDTFTRIVVDGEAIAAVLEEQGEKLQTLLNETGAPCWPPDPPSSGPCQIESNIQETIK